MTLRILASGNKYSAKKVHAAGYTFASRREYRRYMELCQLQAAGEISELKVHPVYPLDAFSPKGLGAQTIGRYTADFAYVERGRNVTEDVKSEPTRKKADYRLRVKLFRANYPEIEFREVL